MGIDTDLPAARPMSSPLPPLPAVRRSVPDDIAVIPAKPAWSPVRVALGLFLAAWICFGALAASDPDLAGADVGGLGHLLLTGAGIVALVLITLSVAHAQLSGLRPEGQVVTVVLLGLLQGRIAALLSSGPADMWAPAAHVFDLIGFAIPLTWVGSQFQRGIRRQRFEQSASLVASWIERARDEAHETVQSAHRHDVRSMLFVIDGAARALSDPSLTSAEQRVAFHDMLTESIERLGFLMDVRAEEIQSFAVEGVARAVVHAERKAGRAVTAELPNGLTGVGRAADVAAVLRTLVGVVDRQSSQGVEVSGALDAAAGAIVVRVEPAGAEPLPLLSNCWEEVWVETFKSSFHEDDIAIDLYVAARLLAEQGADLWSAAGGRFAVRVPAAPTSNPHQEEA